MIRFIEGGADEFRHAAVYDGELACGAFLHVQDSGYEGAARGYQGAAQFKVNQLAGLLVQESLEGVKVTLEVRNVQMVGVMVVDSKAASHVDVTRVDARADNLFSYIIGPVAEGGKVVHLQDLGTNVVVDSKELHVVQAKRKLQYTRELLVVDAEFVLRQAGGDVGVGMGTDVRVDPEAYRRHDALGCGQFVNHHQLRRGLHVETGDAKVQAKVDFLVTLANAGEDYLRRLEACVYRGANLAAAHAVRAKAVRRNCLQDTLVVVGLYRIVHPVIRILPEDILDGIQGAAEEGHVVIIERRTETLELLYWESTFKHCQTGIC